MRVYLYVEQKTRQLVFEISIYSSPLFNRSKIYSVDTSIKKNNVVITLANRTEPTTPQ